jgi:hypothetical protein
MSKEITKRTKNTTNKILAIHADSAATPKKPKKPAINDKIKNTKTQSNNILIPFSLVAIKNMALRFSAVNISIKIIAIQSLIYSVHCAHSLASILSQKLVGP